MVKARLSGSLAGMSECISLALRGAVRERAASLCECCSLPESEGFFPFESDYLIALKHEGLTEAAKWANICFECNRLQGTDVASVDPQSGSIVQLFHPRRDRW